MSLDVDGPRLDTELEDPDDPGAMQPMRRGETSSKKERSEFLKLDTKGDVVEVPEILPGEGCLKSWCALHQVLYRAELLLENNFAREAISQTGISHEEREIERREGGTES